MKLRWPILIALLVGCNEDETLSGYVGKETLFSLKSINGAAFNGVATLDLSEAGKVFGDAPCNSYSASQTAPYPWFDAGPIIATKRACEGLALETMFLQALGRMAFAEVSGPILILTNEAKEEMVFEAD